MIQLRKTIQVSKDDFDWLQKTYGEDVNLSWIVSELLSKFRLVHTLTPQTYAEIAAKAFHDEIEEKR